MYFYGETESVQVKSNRFFFLLEYSFVFAIEIGGRKIIFTAGA